MLFRRHRFAQLHCWRWARHRHWKSDWKCGVSAFAASGLHRESGATKGWWNRLRVHKTWQKSVCASGLSNRQSRNKRKGIRKSLPYPRQLSKIRYLGIATTQKQRLQRRDTPTPPPIPHKRNLTIQPKKPDHKSLSNNILPKKTPSKGWFFWRCFLRKMPNYFSDDCREETRPSLL